MQHNQHPQHHSQHQQQNQNQQFAHPALLGVDGPNALNPAMLNLGMGMGMGSPFGDATGPGGLPMQMAFGAALAGLPGFGNGNAATGLGPLDTAGPPLPPNFPDPFGLEGEGGEDREQQRQSWMFGNSTEVPSEGGNGSTKANEYSQQMQMQQQMQLQIQIQLAMAMQQQQAQQHQHQAQAMQQHMQQQQQQSHDMQQQNMHVGSLDAYHFHNQLQQYPHPLTSSFANPLQGGAGERRNLPSSSASSYTNASSLFSGVTGSASGSGRTSLTSLSTSVRAGTGSGGAGATGGVAGKWTELLGDGFLSPTLSHSSAKSKSKSSKAGKRKASSNSPTATTGRSGSGSVMSDEDSLSTSNFNPRSSLSDDEGEGGSSDGGVGELANGDPLAAQVWKMYARDKAALPHAQRMENLTWRMMALALKKKKRKEELEARLLAQQLQEREQELDQSFATSSSMGGATVKPEEGSISPTVHLGVRPEDVTPTPAILTSGTSDNDEDGGKGEVVHLPRGSLRCALSGSGLTMMTTTMTTSTFFFAYSQVNE